MRIYNGLKFGEGKDRTRWLTFLQNVISAFTFKHRNRSSGSHFTIKTMNLVSPSTNTFLSCSTWPKHFASVIVCTNYYSWSVFLTPKKFLSTQNLTLNKAIKICRAKEAASLYKKALKNVENYKVNQETKKESLAIINTSLKNGMVKENLETMVKEYLEILVIRVSLMECLFCTQARIMKKELFSDLRKICMVWGGNWHF